MSERKSGRECSIVEQHEVFVMCELWYWLVLKRAITAVKCSRTVWREGGGSCGSEVQHTDRPHLQDMFSSI
jgi:hypothetical protein